ncbi:MAG: serine/threonine protein kinase [Planctomycetes bacterium]|nr:serine/threonine protein kinase [Planctomycetota bacterium]
MPAEFEELLAQAIELQELGDEPGLERLFAARPDLREQLRAALALLPHTQAALSSLTGLPERFGEFRRLERIGSGGMGIVYLGEQESLRRRVAIKVMRPELLLSDRVRARFLRESETIARLQHPGIVQVLAVGHAGPVPYLVMELLEGCSLADLLQRHRNRPVDSLRADDFVPTPGATPPAGTRQWWQACVTAIAEVAETVAFVHSHGVLHRDLKPSNVFLTAQGRTKLLDFGLARGATDLQLTQNVGDVGSPAYMSPEQLCGEALDERTDVYSLGVTLHQLLTLRLPFPATTAEPLRSAILDGAVNPRWWHGLHLPRDLVLVVDQAMQRQRERRYRSMAEFAGDLRAVLSAGTIVARAPSLLARAERWRRRHPFLAGALGVATGVALLAPLPMWAWQHAQAQQLDSALTRANGDLDDAQAVIRRMFEHADSLDLSRVPEAEGPRLQMMQDAIAFYDRMIERHPQVGTMRTACGLYCWLYARELRELGRRAECEAALAHAEELYSHPTVPDSLEVGVQRILVAKLRASTARESGDPARCEQWLDFMAALADRLQPRFPRDIDIRLQASEIPNERAHARDAIGKIDEQLALLAEALDKRRQLAADRPDVPLVLQSVAAQCLNLADALRQHEREPSRALALYEEALTILTTTPPPPNDYYGPPMHAEMLIGRGAMHRRLGDAAAAERDLRDGIERLQAMMVTSPRAVRRARNLLDGLVELATLQLDRGQRDAAVATTARAEATAALLETATGATKVDRMLLRFRALKERVAQ